jgi:hypothetical protein
VSVKLTPEICINNASSNSRLTAASRQVTATDTIHRTVYRLFFSPLPTFDEKTTELHLHAEKLSETVLHLNLGHFVGGFFGQFCSTLCIPFDEKTTEHLKRDLQNCTLRWTPKLLTLKLHCIWTWGFFNFFIFYFSFCFILFIYIFFHLLIFYFDTYLYFFVFYFQSSVSLMPAQLTVN